MRRDPNYCGDVEYEVWRRGGNPDCVDRDRLADYEYDGRSAESAARAELERQRPLEPEPEYEPGPEPEPEEEVSRG